MESSIDLQSPQIVLSAAAQKNPDPILTAIQNDRNSWREDTECMNGFSKWEIPMRDQLKSETENNLRLAESILIDVGYTPNEARSRLPKLEQIHFYETDCPGNIVYASQSLG